MKLAETAHDFAKSGGVMDKKTANDIISTSGKVREGGLGGRRKRIKRKRERFFSFSIG